MRCSSPPSLSGSDEICRAAAAIGLQVLRLHAIAPDASTRRFFRVELANHPTVVACLYPPGEESRLDHDWEAHQWAWHRRLPVPAPLARASRVTLSADLGSCDLERALRVVGLGVLPEALKCLQFFQVCPLERVPNPPFDAALFYRELEAFASFLPPPIAADSRVRAFFADLAQRLETHPYRLTHRDFHVNNLLLHQARVWAVDFQDLRPGPDTYDLVSLLRERAGGELVSNDEPWRAEAARQLDWSVGWLDRFRECACQRGLKVLGTFLRLGGHQNPTYLAHVPAVAAKLVGSLEEIAAPAPLVAAVADLVTTNAYNPPEEES